MIAQSPPGRTHTAIGSIAPRHSEARSPGISSTCRLHKHHGQWFRWAVPGASVGTSRRQWTHRNDDGGFTWEWSPETGWTPTTRVTRPSRDKRGRSPMRAAKRLRSIDLRHAMVRALERRVDSAVHDSVAALYETTAAPDAHVGEPARFT